MMPDRNNYARIDVGILYRLCMVMYQTDVHNYSVQSVDSSERTIVVYVQIVSFHIGFLNVLIDFLPNRAQRYIIRTKSFCVAEKKFRFLHKNSEIVLINLSERKAHLAFFQLFLIFLLSVSHKLAIILMARFGTSLSALPFFG